jgi:Grap2 and cyclin-D-interacting
VLFSNEELHPLMTNIEMSLLGLVSTFYTLPVSEGQILHKAVCQTVIGVVEAVLDLLKSLQLKQTAERLALYSFHNKFQGFHGY